jgi:succinoglycan biosynthesis protein ExoV
MELFYYKSESGNFGDDLNAWLWPKVFPGVFVDKSDVKFIGIGTILDQRICDFKKKIVFGSGVRGLKNAPSVDRSWEIYAVRGFLSSRALGVDSKYVITDPAIIAKIFYSFNKQKLFPVSYMPYFRSAHNQKWKNVCEEIGVNYIDPRSDVKKCLKEIALSSYLITEAMHGAIIADSFRVPWAPVFAYNYLHEKEVSEFKWRDWLSTVAIDFFPKYLPNLWGYENNYVNYNKLKEWVKVRIIQKKINQIIKNQEYFLSSDTVEQNNIDKYVDLIEKFKIKYSNIN